MRGNSTNIWSFPERFGLNRIGRRSTFVSLASGHPPDRKLAVTENDAQMHNLLQIFAFIWAAPYTLIGLVLGAIGLCTGGHARISGRTIEFHGGAVKWFVSHLPPGPSTLAITLRHTILGQSSASLDIARDHEMVHVA